MATSTEVAIATQTLSSAATNITFTSIPATYTDLRIVFTGTGNGTVFYPTVQFNSDTATNYSLTEIYGDGTSAASTRTTNGSSIGLARLDGATSTIPVFITLDIFSYAGSTYKTTLSTNSSDHNGSGVTESIVGLWRSTSAITSVKIFDPAGRSMGTGASATLYGIN